jgi:hypothetical protein
MHRENIWQLQYLILPTSPMVYMYAACFSLSLHQSCIPHALLDTVENDFKCEYTANSVRPDQRCGGFGSRGQRGSTRRRRGEAEIRFRAGRALDQADQHRGGLRCDLVTAWQASKAILILHPGI